MRKASKLIHADSNKKKDILCVREEESVRKGDALEERNPLRIFQNIPRDIHDIRKISDGLEGLYIPSLTTNDSLNNFDKARMVREINLKIELLESKSKQPGTQL